MDNSPIVFLKGPERVRKRPCVIFGADGTEGVVSAIKMLLEIFVTEASLGFSSGIDVKIHKDNSVSIRSYDKGLILDETIIDGKPAWHQIFCEMYAAPRKTDEKYYYSLGHKHNNLFGISENELPEFKTDTDNGFNLCCVQYASKYMFVESTREGVKKTLEFKDGFSVSDMRKETTEEQSNTFIHFLLEENVFGKDITVPQDEIGEFLKEISISIPTIKCKLTDERSDFETIYHYPNGVKDYIREITKNSAEPFIAQKEATGKDRYNQNEYTAKVKLSVCFSGDAGKILCLHNFKKLEQGGKHLTAIKEKLMRFVNWEFMKDLSDESNNVNENSELSFNDIKDNIILIIETVCDNNATSYETARKKAIDNRMITDISSDLISEDFRYYLKQNRNAVLPIIEKSFK